MSSKNLHATLLLGFFFGFFGGHRFYAGKILTGFLQLVTLGGLGIWTMVDLIFIVTGEFKDSSGSKISKPKLFPVNWRFTYRALWLFSILFFGLGGGLFVKRQIFLSRAILVTAKVEGYEERGSGHDNSTTYCPVVAYLNSEGEKVSTRLAWGKSNRQFAIGHSLEVLHDRDSGKCIRNKWGYKWGIVAFLLGDSIVFFIVGVFMRASVRTQPNVRTQPIA